MSLHPHGIEMKPEEGCFWCLVEVNDKYACAYYDARKAECEARKKEENPRWYKKYGQRQYKSS